jgi:hypothetical protein
LEQRRPAHAKPDFNWLSGPRNGSLAPMWRFTTQHHAGNIHQSFAFLPPVLLTSCRLDWSQILSNKQQTVHAFGFHFVLSFRCVTNKWGKQTTNCAWSCRWCRFQSLHCECQILLRLDFLPMNLNKQLFFRPTPLGFRQVVQHARLHVAYWLIHLINAVTASIFIERGLQKLNWHRTSTQTK